MSYLRRLGIRARRRRRPLSAAPVSSPEDEGIAELRRRRDTLAEEFAELQCDIGGLAYEMAIRDHFRLDVIVRRAAKLQELEAELGEVERMLKLGEAGAGGVCPACGALHAKGAAFCSQCGTGLLERVTIPGL